MEKLGFMISFLFSSSFVNSPKPREQSGSAVECAADILFAAPIPRSAEASRHPCYEIPYLQLFHVCQEGGRFDTYFCPNQTLFSQALLTCDWWYNVDCAHSEDLYHTQENLYGHVGVPGGPVGVQRGPVGVPGGPGGFAGGPVGTPGIYGGVSRPVSLPVTRGHGTEML